MHRTATIVFLATCGLFAQSNPVTPAFEAASVKVNTTGSNGSSSHGSKGQVIISNTSLKRLIERAYNVKPIQVICPDWMEGVRFDISAKYPPDASNEDRAVMLRKLLEERFKLSVHRETRELAGYALVVAKSGFKLKPVEPGPPHNDSDGELVEVLNARKTSMVNLADIVSRIIGELVVDKTGLDGVYDFTLRFANERGRSKDDAGADATEPTGAPSLRIALEETLGIQLRAQKVPVEVIVADHADRVPIEN